MSSFLEVPGRHSEAYGQHKDGVPRAPCPEHTSTASRRVVDLEPAPQAEAPGQVSWPFPWEDGARVCQLSVQNPGLGSLPGTNSPNCFGPVGPEMQNPATCAGHSCAVPCVGPVHPQALSWPHERHFS